MTSFSSSSLQRVQRDVHRSQTPTATHPACSESLRFHSGTHFVLLWAKRRLLWFSLQNKRNRLVYFVVVVVLGGGGSFPSLSAYALLNQLSGGGTRRGEARTLLASARPVNHPPRCYYSPSGFEGNESLFQDDDKLCNLNFLEKWQRAARWKLQLDQMFVGGGGGG